MTAERSAGGIPALLHRIWVGPRPLPEECESFWDRWRALHPLWTLITWCDAEQADVLQARHEERFGVFHQLQWRDIRTIALPETLAGRRFEVPAQTADVYRLAILDTHGGVYVDVDVEPRKPIEALLDGSVQVVCGWESADWLGTAFIAARPDNRYLKAVLARAARNLVTHPDAGINYQTGPKVFTRMLAGAPDADVRRLSPALLYPYAWDEPERRDERFDDAFAVHRWHGSWLDRPAP